MSDQISTITSKIRRRPGSGAGKAIFLLDQYGWSQVAFRSIRVILEQLQKAEVFLTFSVDALIDSSTHSHQMRAFGEIDIDPGLVQELVGLKQAEQLGYRILIQNGLYSHIQSVTGAPFYSPFFIKSGEAGTPQSLVTSSSPRPSGPGAGSANTPARTTYRRTFRLVRVRAFAPAAVSPCLEMKLLLSMLYRNFNVERVGGAEGVRENFAFAMSPVGLNVRLRRRSKSPVDTPFAPRIQGFGVSGSQNCNLV